MAKIPRQDQYPFRQPEQRVLYKISIEKTHAMEVGDDGDNPKFSPCLRQLQRRPALQPGRRAPAHGMLRVRDLMGSEPAGA